MDYLAVDCSPLPEGSVTIKIKSENYMKAVDWAVSKFGNFGEDNWWPAPYLVEDIVGNSEGKKLIQKYEFIFLSNDHALQFKLMGF